MDHLRIFAALAIGTVLMAGCQQKSLEEKPKVGFFAPDFELQKYDGTLIRLANFRGKTPVMLNFWAGWCPYCLEEMPAMAAMQEEFGDKLAVVAVNRGQKLEAAKRFTDALNLSDVFTIVLDPKDKQFGRYNGIAMPTTFFIDRDGVIKEEKIGPMDSKEMREKIRTNFGL